MPAAGRQSKHLSDAGLQQLLASYTAVAALGMDPPDAQIGQVYFLDTPELVTAGPPGAAA